MVEDGGVPEDFAAYGSVRRDFQPGDDLPLADHIANALRTKGAIDFIAASASKRRWSALNSATARARGGGRSGNNGFTRHEAICK